MSYKYLFGPVPSRRVGTSLGVDLVPYKICSFDCVYCEVGETTNLTMYRDEYVPKKEVIEDLCDYLKHSPKLDYITFSGSGEPLLNCEIKNIITYLKTNFPQYKLALLTNASLLYDRDIRNEIKDIDLIMPSLDAVQDDVFQKINRPHDALDINSIINGLIYCRNELSSNIWLEVLFIPGYNDSAEHLTKLKEVLSRINPDKIQLNTLDRPGNLANLKPATYNYLKKVCDFFSPLHTEIISSISRYSQVDSFKKDIYDMILQTLQRRPCTDDDLCFSLGIHRNEMNKYIQELVKKNKITMEKQSRGYFWRYVR